MEAIIATAIAVIAVLGLAHSFGMGRALIERYEVGRMALGAATRRIEYLGSRTPAAVTAPAADSVAFLYKGQPIGMEVWSIQWVDDPYDGIGVGDISGGTNDYKRATITIRWLQSSGGGMNRVELRRVIRAS